MIKRSRTFRFPATAVAMACAIIALADEWVLGTDFVDVSVTFLNPVRASPIEEVTISLSLLLLAFLLDKTVAARRLRRERELQRSEDRLRTELAIHSANEKLRAVQTTMRTVHDIVNNSLNELQLFRLDAEDHGIGQVSLDLFDGIIQSTAAKLKILGDIKVYAEKEMAAGAGLDAALALTV